MKKVNYSKLQSANDSPGRVTQREKIQYTVNERDRETDGHQRPLCEYFNNLCWAAVFSWSVEHGSGDVSATTASAKLTARKT